MSLNDAMPVPQLSDIDPSDAKAVARFTAQVRLLRSLGIKEYTDHAGRKVVLFEKPQSGWPEGDET